MGDVAGHDCVLSEQSHYVKVRWGKLGSLVIGMMEWHSPSSANVFPKHCTIQTLHHEDLGYHLGCELAVEIE